jgi:hypothetical protein
MNEEEKKDQEKLKLTPDSSLILGLSYQESIKKLFGDDFFDKAVIVTKWHLGCTGNAKPGISLPVTQWEIDNPDIDELTVYPEIDDKTASCCYLLEKIHDAVRVFDIFGKTPIYKVVPDKAMPLLIECKEKSDRYEYFNIIIAPRIPNEDEDDNKE